MKLIKLLNIQHDSGFCYIANLDLKEYPGENLNSLRKSQLILFEDGVSIGVSSSSHEDIRKIGKGLFSHWENQLYFSSSDNTSPLKSDHEYVVQIPNDIEEETKILSKLIYTNSLSSKLLNNLIINSISTNGGEFHSSYSFRMFLMYLNIACVDIKKTIGLELGASPTNGLAICLGLAGIKHLYLNNIVSINNNIDVQFAENISLLCSLMLPTSRELDEIVIFSEDKKSCRLNPDIFTVVDNTNALNLQGKVSNIDLIFSLSVLEHMRDLPQISKVLKQLSNDGCVSIHSIDARDHTDFSNPLKYLYLSEEEFLSSYSKDHNRWRYSDYKNFLANAGWTIEQSFYTGTLPVLPNGNTDMFEVARLGPEKWIVSNQSKLPVTVTANEVKKMDEEFQKYSLEELSSLVFTIICRA